MEKASNATFVNGQFKITFCVPEFIVSLPPIYLSSASKPHYFPPLLSKDKSKDERVNSILTRGVKEGHTD